MSRILGIDLGTTNSCVSVMDGDEVVIIPSLEGGRTIPSVVSFSKTGINVGQSAKRQAAINPSRTFDGIKRVIGRSFHEPVVQDFVKKSSFKLKESSNGGVLVEVDGRTYSPEDISSFVVKRLAESARAYFNEDFDCAVVAVPAYFNDSQRQATRDAVEKAGLNVMRIVNEPTLAALAYGYQKEKSGYFVVFDLGGGTFDVSVLELQEGTFKVLATSGNNCLGGDDFDAILYAELSRRFESESGVSISSDGMAVQRLKEAVEVAKCELSTLKECEINLPFLAVGSSGPVHFSTTLKRTELESLVKVLVDKLEAPCLDALSHAKISAEDISEVLMVGGMTRMPCVESKVESIFGRKAHKGINPDEIVALGAGVQGGILSGEVEEAVLLDVTPLNLGIRVVGDKVAILIKRNTSIPTRASKFFTTTEDNQEFVSLTIVQGDSEKASENACLGQLVLSGISPLPAGQARIKVEFMVDSNGVVHVMGIDERTGLAQTLKINKIRERSQSVKGRESLMNASYVKS